MTTEVSSHRQMHTHLKIEVLKSI